MIVELNQLIQEEVKKQKEKKRSEIPDFLKKCVDPITKDLPSLPTTSEETDMKKV